jgi:hypothetical protein
VKTHTGDEVKAFGQTVAVIRTYGNPMVKDSVQRLLDMPLGAVIVVINADSPKEQEHETKLILERTFTGYVKTLQLIIYEMHNYGWSAALNLALSTWDFSRIREMDWKYVLNISTEVTLRPASLQAMLNVMEQDSNVKVVGTTFAAQDHATGKRVKLGPSYTFPRNTCLVANVLTLATINRFDVQCDAHGGMEDFDFMLRMLTSSDRCVRMVNGRVPITVGVYGSQFEKEWNEEAAMEWVIQKWLNESKVKGRLIYALQEMCHRA